MIKLSMWTDILNELPPEKAIDRLLETPFENLEFSCGHLDDWIKNDKSPKMLKNIKSKIDARGVEFIQLHAPIFNFLEDEEAEKKLKWCEDALELAGYFDIPWVVIHPGSIEGWQQDEALREKVIEENVKTFNHLLQKAKKEGTGIAIENMFKNKFGSTVSELKFLLDELSSSRAGILWDTGHANLVYKNQLRALQNIKDEIVGTHIADNRGENDDHLYPLRGEINWEEVIPVLSSLEIPFNFEVPGEGATSPLEIRDTMVNYGYELGDFLLEEYNNQKNS